VRNNTWQRNPISSTNKETGFLEGVVRRRLLDQLLLFSMFWLAHRDCLVGRGCLERSQFTLNQPAHPTSLSEKVFGGQGLVFYRNNLLSSNLPTLLI
jgi:hypothetical protein